MNGNCVVCGTEYANRKGKIYCSDACKTKAYDMRKAGKTITGEAERPKGATIVFDVAEYEAAKIHFSDFSMSLDSYCFFRKNLPNKYEPEKIANIIHGYWDSAIINEAGNIESNNASLQHSFGEFQKNFFSGMFEIRDSREILA